MALFALLALSFVAAGLWIRRINRRSESSSAAATAERASRR